MSVSEATAHNPELPHILKAMSVSAARVNQQAASVTVPRDCLEALAGTTKAAIVVTLPGDAVLDVSQMLEGPLQVFNHQSTDLLTARTILSIGHEGNELWLDSCHLPDALDYDDKSFVVVVTRGDSLWRKCFAPADFDELVCDLRSHEASSGLNYRPYRIWTDEQLEEAAMLAMQEPTEPTPLMPLALCFGLE